jgi:hypothetical protein
MVTIYILYSEIYYEPYIKNYFNILTLNKEPDGELKKYTKHIRITKQSTNDQTLTAANCTYAISNNFSNTNTNTNINLMTLEQLDDFTQFIINNNYRINDELTQIHKNVGYNNKRLIYAFELI